MPRKRPFNSHFSQNRTAEDLHLNFPPNDQEWNEQQSKYTLLGFSSDNIYRILLTHVVTAIYGFFLFCTVLKDEHYSSIGNLYFMPVLAIHVVFEYFKYFFFHKHRSSSHKSMNHYTWHFPATYILAVAICYLFAVLFGADFFENIEGTFMFSCIITTLAVVPLYFEAGTYCLLLILFQRQTSHFAEKITLIVSHCVIIGAWVGAFVIPLDWNRPWQVWPIPCVIGALIGYIIGELISCGKILMLKCNV